MELIFENKIFISVVSAYFHPSQNSFFQATTFLDGWAGHYKEQLFGEVNGSSRLVRT